MTVAGHACSARDLIAQQPVGAWVWHPQATYGRGKRAVAGHLVVGRSLRVVPEHQANPGGLRHRAVQAARRQAHLRHKHRRPDASVETDEWVLLFTTHTTAQAAPTGYRGRWAMEGSFRDGQGGWDGRHGWNLEPTMAALGTAARSMPCWGGGHWGHSCRPGWGRPRWPPMSRRRWPPRRRAGRRADG